MATGVLSAGVIPAQAELRSFARVAAHLLAEHPTPALGARTVKRRAGHGLQHLDHRDYVPGDEVRHIDWRQTARLRRPVVRQFEAETSGDWFLMLDASSSMAVGTGEKWRAAVRVTAAMSYALLELGHRVAVITFADDVVDEVPPGRGARHFPSIVRSLQRLQPSPDGATSNLAACARRLRGTASALVVSDFLGPSDLRPGLAALRQRCVLLHAIEVHDERQLELPGPGPIELRDVETGATLVCDADAATVAAADPPTRADFERQLVERLASPNAVAQLAYFEFHPAAAAVRLRAAREQASQGRTLSAELLLRQLLNQPDADTFATADSGFADGDARTARSDWLGATTAFQRAAAAVASFLR